MTGHTREQGEGGHTSLSGDSKYIPRHCDVQVLNLQRLPYIHHGWWHYCATVFFMRCSKFFFGHRKTICLGEELNRYARVYENQQLLCLTPLLVDQSGHLVTKRRSPHICTGTSTLSAEALKPIYIYHSERLGRQQNSADVMYTEAKVYISSLHSLYLNEIQYIKIYGFWTVKVAYVP